MLYVCIASFIMLYNTLFYPRGSVILMSIEVMSYIYQFLIFMSILYDIVHYLPLEVVLHLNHCSCNISTLHCVLYRAPLGELHEAPIIYH